MNSNQFPGQTSSERDLYLPEYSSILPEDRDLPEKALSDPYQPPSPSLSIAWSDAQGRRDSPLPSRVWAEKVDLPLPEEEGEEYGDKKTLLEGDELGIKLREQDNVKADSYPPQSIASSRATATRRSRPFSQSSLSNYRYQLPIIPYAKPVASAARCFLPGMVLFLITSFCWIFAIQTRTPVPAPSYFLFLATPAQLNTYIITFLSSVLAVLVAWSFGRSAAFYISKRIARSPCSVSEISSWLCIGTNRIRWTLSFWALVSVVSTFGLSLQVSGFTALLTPRHYLYSYSFNGKAELDLNSAGFARMFDQRPHSEDEGVNINTHFIQLLLEGLADIAVNNKETHIEFPSLNEYHFGSLTAGVLPFNSVLPGDKTSLRTINLGSDEALNRHVQGKPNNWKYNLTQTLQGRSADVQCLWRPTSPISNSFPSTEAEHIRRTVQCDASSPVVTLELDHSLDVAAYACDQTLYIRFEGDLVVLPERPDLGDPQENLTCTMNPFLTISNVTYNSLTDVSTVLSSTEDARAHTPQFHRYLGKEVENLQDRFNSPKQGQVFFEAIAQFRQSTSKLDTQRAWSQFLQGMVMLHASAERLEWNVKAAQEKSSGDIWRSVPASVTFELFGWWCTTSTLFLLVPLTLIAVSGLGFIIAGLLIPGDLLSFDPTDVESLVLAVARGNFAEIAVRPYGHEVTMLEKSELRFKHDPKHPLRPWGLFM